MKAVQLIAAGTLLCVGGSSMASTSSVLAAARAHATVVRNIDAQMQRDARDAHRSPHRGVHSR